MISPLANIALNFQMLQIIIVKVIFDQSDRPDCFNAVLTNFLEVLFRDYVCLSEVSTLSGQAPCLIFQKSILAEVIMVTQVSDKG